LISTRDASSRSDSTPKLEKSFFAVLLVSAGSASTVVRLFGNPRRAASACHSSE
jgi:hypothetical protein